MTLSAQNEIQIDISGVIAENFHDITCDVMERKFTHYWYGGGRGSTKSSNISIDIILLIIFNPGVNALVLRKVGATVRDSVYNQILWAIEKLEIAHLFKVTLSPLEIIYTETGQVIYFRGADDPIKIKSIKPRRGYIGVVWFEETDQFGGMEEIRDILQSTNRGGDRYWNFYSYNPPKSRDNWVNVERYETSADKIYHHSTYENVPREWLGEQFIYDAEKLRERKPQAYEHEYLGIATGTGGNVFENVTVDEIPGETSKQFERYCYGVDWGYYPDPWAFVKCSYDAHKRILYIIDERVEYKQTNRQTADMIREKGLTYDDMLICDSAEPKSIAEYREYGLYAKGADKGAGSLDYSMKWLQGLHEIFIDKNKCPNTAKEFLSYEYERNKNNEIISGYPDKNNHLIDAVRYATNLLWT